LGDGGLLLVFGRVGFGVLGVDGWVGLSVCVLSIWSVFTQGSCRLRSGEFSLVASIALRLKDRADGLVDGMLSIAFKQSHI
jgi:hypothetical protein